MRVRDIRHAPLLLIPVSLERGTAGERFRLRARPEDFATNLSLENVLDPIHGIRLRGSGSKLASLEVSTQPIQPISKGSS
ncbi:DUF4011 domain-containing protein [Paracoccus sp. MA]|uniref:DUF4011 domain-containing protein n=1 Tax=Paracoccus sp. MA TaxID=2895796 RepID=UPI00353008C8